MPNLPENKEKAGLPQGAINLGRALKFAIMHIFSKQAPKVIFET